MVNILQKFDEKCWKLGRKWMGIEEIGTKMVKSEENLSLLDDRLKMELKQSM